MAGLDPAIQVSAVPQPSDLDARVKPGHDGLKAGAMLPGTAFR
jgi:hypothetical protein